MKTVYTIYDEDNETTVRGTLQEIETHFSGYAMLQWDCQFIEIAWDYGWEDGPHYWSYPIIKIEQVET